MCLYMFCGGYLYNVYTPGIHTDVRYIYKQTHSLCPIKTTLDQFYNT